MLWLNRISSGGVVPEKYSDENVQNPTGWDEQDGLLTNFATISTSSGSQRATAQDFRTTYKKSERGRGAENRLKGEFVYRLVRQLADPVRENLDWLPLKRIS